MLSLCFQSYLSKDICCVLLIFFLFCSLCYLVLVEQLGELMKQLEKERELKSDEATTYLTGVKSESESKRQNLEERQKNVEAVLAEVP